MHTRCDCFDDYDTSIGLGFNLDSNSANGFKRSEIENAIFIKFNKSGTIIDTTKLIRNEYYFEKGFTINDYRATQVKTFQDTCSYRVINSVGNVDLFVSDIIFNGEFAGGCCDCYKNESISFKVNGEQQNLGGNGRSGAAYLINKK
jgi:hypothetical protein